RIFEEIKKCFMGLFSLELWEREHKFPEKELFSSWLHRRYMQATLAIEFPINAGLILNNHEVFQRDAVYALGVVSQDVDDIVNIVEYRENIGENDDLQTGVVSRPLLEAIEQVPSLAKDVARLWEKHRPLAKMDPSIRELQIHRANIIRETLPLYTKIRS